MELWWVMYRCLKQFIHHKVSIPTNKKHQKGEQTMSRTLTTEEKEILKIMVKAFPLMSEGKKYQLLGYGQAMIDLKRNKMSADGREAS